MTIEELQLETNEKFGEVHTKVVEIDTRLKAQEGLAKTIRDISLSVNTLAINMKNMLDEQLRQGKRLDALEETPKKRWDTLITGVISSIVGIVLGYLFSKR